MRTGVIEADGNVRGRRPLSFALCRVPRIVAGNCIQNLGCGGASEALDALDSRAERIDMKANPSAVAGRLRRTPKTCRTLHFSISRTLFNRRGDVLLPRKPCPTYALTISRAIQRLSRARLNKAHYSRHVSVIGVLNKYRRRARPATLGLLAATQRLPDCRR